MCVGNTLNMDSCSKFGEILREFGEILGKYRTLDGRSPGSIGLMGDQTLIQQSFDITLISKHTLNHNASLKSRGPRLFTGSSCCILYCQID